MSEDALPEPYRSLLVHASSMTTVLECYFNDALTLQPLWRHESDGWYSRQVVLSLTQSAQPVGMGAIHVRLDGLPRDVRETLTAEQMPAGRALANGDADYHARPVSYFAIEPDVAMQRDLRLGTPTALYGRCAEMIFAGSRIGTVVEVIRTI